MTASECLSSTDPKAVGAYMQKLWEKDERAAMLLRAHRCCVRMKYYDSERYLAFLASRCSYAMGALVRAMRVEDDIRTKTDDHSIHFVFHTPFGSMTFRKIPDGDWESAAENEEIVSKLCNKLMPEEVSH